VCSYRAQRAVFAALPLRHAASAGEKGGVGTQVLSRVMAVLPGDYMTEEGMVGALR
jgi:hypothetical protein